GSIRTWRDFTTMHGSTRLVDEFLYGFDESFVYLRISLVEKLSEMSEKDLEFKVQINQLRLKIKIDTHALDQVHVVVDPGSENEFSAHDHQVKAADILEMKISRLKIATNNDEKIRFKVTTLRNQMPIDVIPAVGEGVMDPRSSDIQSKLWP